MGAENYLIYIPLFLCKFARHRVCAGVVRAVAFERLCTCIYQEQTTILQDSVAIEVVECFTVLRHNAWERNTCSIRLHNTLHCSCNLSLHNASLTHLHRCGMHSITYLEGTLHSLNLLARLHLAHLRHGKHQIHRLVWIEFRYRQTQKARKFNLALTTIWWQVVNLATRLHRCGNNPVESLQGLAIRHSDLGTQLHEAWLRTCPDDILDGKVVAKEHRLARLGIYDTHKCRQLQTKIVLEGRVLTEVVGVVGIVVWRIEVSGDKDNTLTYTTAQLGTTRYVGCWTEHS